MDFEDLFLEHLSKFDRLPFLFVGSGLGRRYMNLPSWPELLKECSKWTGKSFEYYSSKAKSDLPATASLIAEDFFEIWWRNGDYATSIKDNLHFAKDRHSPLKIEIVRYFNRFEVIEDNELEKEIELFKSSKFDGIITTNYDTILEKFFPDYVTYIGQENLLFNQTFEVAENYKIHGCVSDPNSMVLTSEDYENFNRKNPYLIAKLLTIFVDHPIIFIGYSLKDDNINSIFESILNCLNEEKLKSFSERLIFIEWNHLDEPENIKKGIIVTKNSKLPVTVISAHSFQKIFKALSSLERKIPAKVLRALKNRIFNLIKTNDDKVSMYVRDFEEDLASPKLSSVYGIGKVSSDLANAEISEKGYKGGITSSDIFNDLVFDSENFSSNDLLIYTIPHLLKSSPYIPYFKYLRLEDRLKSDGTIDLDGLDKKLTAATTINQNDFIGNSNYATHFDGVQKIKGGIPELKKAYEKNYHQVMHLAMLPLETIDIQEFQIFLKQNFTHLSGDNVAMKTQMKKLICLYDYLKYRFVE